MAGYLIALGLCLGLIGQADLAAATDVDYATSCLKADALNQYLDRAFAEARIAHGELENGNRVELFAARSGTWTMVESMPDGYGCIHSYGRGLKVDGDNRQLRPHS